MFIIVRMIDNLSYAMGDITISILYIGWPQRFNAYKLCLFHSRYILSKCPGGIKIRDTYLPQQPTIMVMSRYGNCIYTDIIEY